MKFLLKKRKHQYYLLVGVLLMVLFFIGYRLITNKITSEAEGLIEVVIKQYAKEKESILQFDFNDFNKFIVDTQKIIESSADSDRSELKNRLLFNSELAFSEENIDVSFVYFLEDKEVLDSYLTAFDTG